MGRLRQKRDERPPLEVIGAEPNDEAETTIAVGKSGRSKVAYAAAVVFVGFLVVSLLAGRDGETGNDAAEEASAFTTSTVRGESSAASTSPTTRPRRSTTTTTIPVPVLPGVDVRVVLSQTPTDAHVLDLGSGARTDLDVPGNILSTATLRDGVVATNGSRARWFPFTGGRPLDLGSALDVVANDATSVWLVSDDDSAPGRTARLVTVHSIEGMVEPSPEIQVGPGWVAGADVEGLLTDAGGRVYRVQRDGTVVAVTDGELMAVSNGWLIVRRCDDNASCWYEMSAPGAQARRLPLTVAFDRGAAQFFVRPDGRYIAVTAHVGEAPMLLWIDIDEGTTETVEPTVGRVPGNWSDLPMAAWLPGDLGLVVARESGLLRVRPQDEALLVEDFSSEGATFLSVVP